MSTTKRASTKARSNDESACARYEIVNWQCERDAFAAAHEAALTGVADVEVVLRPASGGPVWGYSFSARPPKAVWVIEGPEGEWLSEEEAANEVEALLIYHATGGVNGFTAYPVLQAASAAAD